MAKKKAARKKPEKSEDDLSELEKFLGDEFPPIIKWQATLEGPVEANKVYTKAQFLAVLGMDDRTLKGYFNAGLPFRKVKGHTAVFVRGQDWFDFFDDQKHLAKDIDELSEEPSPLGQLADLVFRLESKIDKLESQAVDAEFYGQEVDSLGRRAGTHDDRLARLEQALEELLRTMKDAAEKP